MRQKKILLFFYKFQLFIFTIDRKCSINHKLISPVGHFLLFYMHQNFDKYMLYGCLWYKYLTHSNHISSISIEKQESTDANLLFFLTYKNYYFCCVYDVKRCTCELYVIQFLTETETGRGVKNTPRFGLWFLINKYL